MVSGLARISVNGKLYNTSSQAEPCWIESKDIDLETRDQKYIDTFFVEHKCEGETEARIQFGWRDRLQDPITWGDWFMIKDSDDINWTRFTARYLKIRIEDENPIWPWKLSCIDVFGRMMKGRL